MAMGPVSGRGSRRAPMADINVTPDKKPVQISIDQAGQIYIDDRTVQIAALPDLFAQIAAKSGSGKQSPQIFLRADKALDYGRVMAVMGELNRAGLNRVALVTMESAQPVTDAPEAK
jgi:biopolymer transport protein TolR